MRFLWWMSCSATLALSIGCGDTNDTSSSSRGGAGGHGGSGGAGGVSQRGGMPCNVQALLSSKCTSCHSDPPVSFAPMPLVTYDDLAAPAASDPSKTYAELAILRMRASVGLMPPKPNEPATPSEIELLEAWVAAGLPKEECDKPSEPDPLTRPPVCTSNAYWTDGETGVADMNPGTACIACHASKPGGKSPPIFVLAGTVYATGHEPDLCVGGATDKAVPVIIEITDRDGKTTSLPTYSNGNFFLNPGTPVALPFTAKVRYNGKERVMKTPQEVGDCNSCHTQGGANEAPGRIVLP